MNVKRTMALGTMVALALAMGASATASAQTVQVQAEVQADGQVEGDAGVVVVEHDDAAVVVEEEAMMPPPPAQAEVTVQAQMPPPPPAQVAATVEYQLPQVQLRDRSLLQVRLDEHPIGGPIAMLSVGVPVAGIFGLAAYYAYHIEDGVDCTFDDCSGSNRVATAVLGTIAGAGLVLGVIGLIKLVKRVATRARIRRDFRQGTLTLTPGGVGLRF